MVDDAAESGRSDAIRDVKAELDERRIAQGIAIGLPIVTVVMATAVGMLLGTAMAILVLAAGFLLGVIALFWASLRVLSGDAALSPELEALDATAHAVDALSSRKKMLVRALKDLDNERALGKLEDEDYEQLSQTYRAELKEVMRRIDASLEPHRPKAEAEAKAHLLKAGLAGEARGKPTKVPVDEVDDDDDDGDEEDEEDDDDSEEDAAVAPEVTAKSTSAEATTKVDKPTRVTCPSCAVSNELDASFCKKCGTSLGKKEKTDEA